MEQEKKRNLRKPIIVVVLLLLIMLATAVIYYYLWRPSDNDVEKALATVSSLQKNVTVSMPYAFEFLSNPNSITPEIASSFKARTEAYNNALTSLENSPAVQHSSAVSSVYNSYKSDLTRYGQDLASLSLSISAYSDIQVKCDVLAAKIGDVHSKTAFDKASAECEDAIEDADSSPHAIFNAQYFDKYRKVSKYLLGALSSYFEVAGKGNTGQVVGAEATVAYANTEMKKASAATVDYSLKSPSSDFFTKITDALNSLKASLVR
jgi:hypothetical protein